MARQALRAMSGERARRRVSFSDVGLRVPPRCAAYALSLAASFECPRQSVVHRSRVPADRITPLVDMGHAVRSPCALVAQVANRQAAWVFVVEQCRRCFEHDDLAALGCVAEFHTAADCGTGPAYARFAGVESHAYRELHAVRPYVRPLGSPETGRELGRKFNAYQSALKSRRPQRRLAIASSPLQLAVS